MTLGRYNFQVKKNVISFSKLPNNFDNLRIVQISDFHLGSFYGNQKGLKNIVDIVNSLNPDVILFTGDMVNNFFEETSGDGKILSGFKAKYGKFSVLGNHDYGDYSDWINIEEKRTNFEKLISFQREIGFELLLNRTDSIKIGEQEIAIIGVENCGSPPFRKYGDLLKAANAAKDFPFKILLTHDPSHWKREVLPKTDIDLTFSGHTHGFQIGFSFGDFHWSPAKYKYPEWGGLYNQNGRYLYVNTGLGVIGFLGRIGMPPEITLITLHTSSTKISKN